MPSAKWTCIVAVGFACSQLKCVATLSGSHVRDANGGAAEDGIKAEPDAEVIL